jgi:hypothetical protein
MDESGVGRLWLTGDWRRKEDKRQTELVLQEHKKKQSATGYTKKETQIWSKGQGKAPKKDDISDMVDDDDDAQAAEGPRTLDQRPETPDRRTSLVESGSVSGSGGLGVKRQVAL